MEATYRTGPTHMMFALAIVGFLAAQSSGQEADPMAIGRFPIEQLLMTSEEWSYSPWIPTRERSVSFLYLAKDGKALELLGNLYENTTTVSPRPSFNTNSLFLLNLGEWRLNGNTVRLQFDCLGSMYVLGEDPCRPSVVEYQRHGVHLLHGERLAYVPRVAYVPIESGYKDHWRELEKDVFAESCKHPKVFTALKECRTLAAELAIRSPAFAQNGAIPAANTCDGTAGNPALVFTGIPPGTRSLAVIVEDPDVPWLLQSDHTYVHWLRWDLAPETEGIPEGGAEGGINEDGGRGYVDPCPPNGEHRYVFKLFALDTTLGPSVNISTVADLYREMEGHTLAHTETIGRYQRPFIKVAVPLAVLGVLSLVVAGSLYGIYRGIRVMVRRWNAG